MNREPQHTYRTLLPIYLILMGMLAGWAMGLPGGPLH